LDALYKLEHGFPSVEDIVNIYNALGNYFKLAVGSGLEQSFPFDIKDFCNTFRLEANKVLQSLKILEQQGMISNSEAVFLPSRLQFVANREDLYRFQIEHRNLDPLIKALLRTYAGLFDEYADINELDIAKQVNSNRKQVMQYIDYLAKAGVVDYQKQSHLPRITYTVARENSRYMRLDKAFINSRKTLYEGNIKAMVGYAANKTRCRSQYILDYFGETDNYRCGTCDICLELNKTGLSDLEIQDMVQAIKEQLGNGKMDIKTLVGNIHRYPEEKVLHTLKWLLDNGQVQTIENNGLIWSE
jgi:ATP-dependent DNA helicase RecQ